jgi:hypothetical protein
MKQWTIILTISAVMILFSCNSGPTKEETKAADTAAAAAPAVVVKPVFVPYKVVTIQPKVRNYVTWKKAFDADDSLRKAHGINFVLIGRDQRDTNMVYVLSKMDDLEKARAFSKIPNLREASKQSGLVGSLGFSYGEVVRENNPGSDALDRLGVSHHVKDFNTWLKSFDADSASRAADGLVESVMARSLVDSNVVYVTFIVTDMEKAKARMASPELKKSMADAGVDSPPTVRWYRVVR